MVTSFNTIVLICKLIFGSYDDYNNKSAKNSLCASLNTPDNRIIIVGAENATEATTIVFMCLMYIYIEYKVCAPGHLYSPLTAQQH